MKKKYIIIPFILLLLIISGAVAHAEECVNADGSPALCNPIKVSSLSGFIAEVLKVLVNIGIPIAVLMLVYTGLRYVMAQGKPEKISEVHQMFIWTIVGITVLVGASLIASIIQGTICQIGFVDLCRQGSAVIQSLQ